MKKPTTTTKAKPVKHDYTLLVEQQREQIRELIELNTTLKKRNSELAARAMQSSQMLAETQNQKLVASANFETMRVTATGLALALLVALVLLAWQVLS